MKKSELPPGTKVVASIDMDEYDTYGLMEFFYNEDDYSTLYGEVLDKKAKPTKVWVRWDETRGYDGRQDEEEVDVKLLSLESDIPEIEKDFKSVAADVKKKMQEAAKLVREANKLVRDKKVAKNLADMMYGAAGPLVSAMDDSGWRSSSWSC